MPLPDSLAAGLDTPRLLPATQAQVRLWKSYRLGERFRTLHNIGGLFRLHGDVDAGRLRLALQEVQKHHGILRATFKHSGDGLWLQIAEATTCEVPFEVRAIPSGDPSVLYAAFREILKIPFDIYRLPPWKLYFFEVAGAPPAIVVAMHHLVSDYQTIGILVKEAVYYCEQLSGRTAVLYETAFTSDEEAHRHFVQQEVEANARYLAEVRAKIDGLRPLTFFGKQIRVAQRSFELDYALFPIDDETRAGIAKICGREKVTPASVYLAAFTLLLLEASEQHEFLIGFPIDGRSGKNNLRAAGFLSSASVLKMTIDLSAPAIELCRYGMREMRQAFRRRFVPLAEAFRRDAGDNTGGSAGIQALFSFVVVPHEKDEGNNLVIDRLLCGLARSDVDVWLTIVNKNNELYGILEFSLDLVDPALIEQLAIRYLALLRGIVGHSAATVETLLTDTTQEGGRIIELAASFSADPIASLLARWCERIGFPARIHLLPYQQIVQSLLGGHATHEVANGHYCLLRLADFFQDHRNPSRTDLQGLVNDVVKAFKSSIARRAIPHVLILCPTLSKSAEVRAAEETLVRDLGSLSGLTCIDLSGLDYSDLFAVDRERLGHIPYHDEFYETLAITVAREEYRIRSQRIKVVVLDCDNTLWQGVIGEDGVDGVVLTEGHLALQRKMVQLHDAGVLIALCSKNDLEIVESFFSLRKDSPLKWEHILTTRISWNTKAEGILSIAQEVNLGLDAFLFLDDNPLEIAEVRYRLPEVLCIQVPAASDAIGPFIVNLWPIDIQQATLEDGQRTSMYRAEAKRQALAEQTLSYSDFIDSLEVTIDVHPLDGDNLSRACQISQRTNQFNLLGTRYAADELLALTDLPDHFVRLVECEDRFGFYGDVGLVVARVSGGTLEVGAFALSCRVLGRGVEVDILRELGRLGLSCHLDALHLVAVKTPRNAPAMNFVRALVAYGEGQCTEDCAEVTLPLSVASQLSHRDLAVNSPTAAAPSPVRNERIDRRREAERLSWIANHLARRHHGQVSSETERRLPQFREAEEAIWEIWVRLLKHPPKDGSERFIAAGLGSLDAIDFVLQIEKQCGVSLSLDAFYASQTFAGLCTLVREQRIPDAVTQDLHTQMFADMELPLAEVPIVVDAAPIVAISQARCVLLTGASGFVGIHLLAELLKQTDARILCLLRQGGPERLETTLEKYRLMVADQAFRRVEVLKGDLGEDHLGLDKEAFFALADRVDVVLHCGAKVNFFESYRTMRQPNVLGTRTLLRLCALRKTKPLHFISTMGVFHSEGLLGANELPESHSPALVSTLPTGYQQSKYVAESLLIRARERGLPVTLIRLGAITGSARTGVMNTQDLFVSLFALVHELGAMPSMRDLDILPVDFVGRAILAIAKDVQAVGQVFNLAHPKALPTQEIKRWYELAGHKLQIVPIDEWVERAKSFIRRQPGHYFAPFMPLVTRFQGAKNLFEILLTAPSVVTRNAQVLLNNAGIAYPPLEQDLFARYLTQYRNIGWLHAPGQRLRDEAHWLLRFPERMQGFCSWSNSPSHDLDYQNAAIKGQEHHHRLDLRLMSHIESLQQVLSEKRIYVTGTVECPLIHDKPLQVRSGYWELRPHGGYRIEDPNSFIFLRYRLSLRNTQGQAYEALGYKVSRNLGAIFFESQSLNLRLFREGEGSKTQVVGQVTIPFAQFIQDQFESMQFRADVDEKAANRYRFLWLLFLAGELLDNYLSLSMKRGSFSIQDVLPLLRMLGADQILKERLTRFRDIAQVSGYLAEFLNASDGKRADV